jgi:hypothetical protein
MGIAALAAAVLASACRESAAPAPAARGKPAAETLASDDRVAYLLAPCAKPEVFIADTSDMRSVLVSKLSGGQLDPMKRAKMELAQQGDAALPELRLLFDKHFKDPEGEPRLLNVITVASLTATANGRDILLRGLEHPADTVRLAAVRGLERHPSPGDYDKLRALLPFAGREMQAELAKALAASDRARLEDDFVHVASPPREAAFRTAVIYAICDTTRADVLDAFRRAYPDASGEDQTFMAAAVARSGDLDAKSKLRSWLTDADAARRGITTQAMVRVGLTADLAPRLREECDDTIRELVAHAIGELPPTKETRAWLASGLSDRSRGVRTACMTALVKVKDDAAENAALELLKGETLELETGVRVLREAWSEDRPLAERALSILRGLRSGDIQPVRVLPLTLDRAISQVPLEAAAEFLYELARTTPGEIGGIRAHRWYLQQAGNTEPAGWSFLRAQWDHETDPARRMDIVMACDFEDSQRARDFITSVVESERTTPIELLYAADLLVHRGPADQVAPLLKRVALRVEDAAVRPALNCILWEWYGASPQPR